jgi:hypothetical protein
MGQELIPPTDDGFNVQERSSSFIIGGMIKYHIHAYTLNKTEPLSLGTILAVIRIVTCWVKWWDQQPVEHRVTKSGQVHPQPDDMPDRDSKFWQLGLDSGKPTDPWKDTRYVYLIDPQTGRDFTFVTDSYGGRMAVGELKSAIRNVHIVRPGALAVIKLGTGTFKSRKFGLVPRPVFEIVEYRGGELKEAPVQLSDQSKPAEKLTLAQELNDEIPTFAESDSSKSDSPKKKTKKK